MGCWPWGKRGDVPGCGREKRGAVRELRRLGEGHARGKRERRGEKRDGKKGDK